MKKLSITILIAATFIQTVLAAKSTLQELTDRQNFLTELLIRVQTETILNHETNSRINHCLSGRNKSEECTIARAQVFSPFPQVVKEARLHLALGYRDGIFGGSFTKLNSGLWKLGTYKDAGWERLTAAEEKIAQGMMDNYIAEARQKVTANKNLTTFAQQNRAVGLLVRQKRLAHLQLYKDLLANIILLQYVSSDKVDSQVMGDAFASLMDRSTKEMNTMSRTARIAENWVKSRKSCAETVDYQINNPTGDGVFAACIQTPAALLNLLDYSGAVSGMLMDYPQYASTLKSIQSERTARSILTGAMIALPTLVVCIFAPPMVAVPAGAAAGGLALLNEQSNYNAVRRRELSKVVATPGSNVDWEALKAARLSRNISVALVPFFGAGKYVSPFLKNATLPAGKMIAGLTKLKTMRYAK